MARQRKHKTATEVRADLAHAGISIAEWARAHGFGSSNVRMVLSGRPALRGQAHRIAVLLGLKAGRIATAADIVALPPSSPAAQSSRLRRCSPSAGTQPTTHRGKS